MENKKHTKRALFGSVIALILCCAMLIGTTFAWFTDTATSGVNTIQSGNLDVVLEYKTAVDGEWAAVGENTKLFKEGALYEPGYTEVVFLRVSNAGNLALKYNLNVNVNSETTSTNVKGETFSLKDYLEIGYYVMDESMGQYLLSTLFGTRDAAISNVASVNGSGFTKLSADTGIVRTDAPVNAGTDTAQLVAVVLTMPTTVGNEANHKTGVAAPTIDLGVSLVATQNTVESDSFDNQYDKDAAYPVVVNSNEELSAAVANAEDDNILLAANVDYGTVTLGTLKNVTISGAENAKVTIKTDADTKIENVTLSNMDFAYTGATVDFAVVCDPDAEINNLVIENCNFTGTGAKAGRGLSGYNHTASIVFRNCEFKDLGYPIYAWGGYASLTVENCTFDNIKSWAIMPQSGFDGDLTVNGCAFTNCLGGGLIKAGTMTTGHTFTFTNNTITGCTIAGDHNWFQFNVSDATSVISGNTKEGTAWTPTAADGLK